MANAAFPLSHGPVHSASPDVVIAVLPFKHQKTFDPISGTSNGIVNFGLENIESPEAAPVEVEGIRLLDPAAYSVQVSSSKGSHNGSANVSFFAEDLSILTEILPQDWIFIWMCEDVQTAEDIRRGLREKTFAQSIRFEPLNGFHSGLKFVGRVASVRSTAQIENNGVAYLRVNLTATSFTEFNSEIYFDPNTGGVGKNSALLFLERLESEVNGFFSPTDSNGKPIARTVDEAVDTLIEIFLGRGPSNRSKQPAELLVSPNEAFYVPLRVGSILNRFKTVGAAKGLAYSDILTTVYGIQNYSNLVNEENPGEYFTPQLRPDSSETKLRCTKPLAGELLFIPTQWAGTSLWGALQPYLNPAINEMYATLRTSSDGTIQPTLVVRQIPFNSKTLNQIVPNSTAFTNLPQWDLPTELTTGEDLGTTASLRVNYVKVFGKPALDSAASQAIEAAFVSPFLDTNDIKRNGLVVYTPTVNMYRSSLTQGPEQVQEFTRIVADRMIGGHLRLSGTIRSKGISLPVAIGDNLRYRNYVFHIESLSHSFSINANGVKSFDTTFQVSNGIPAEASFMNTILEGKSYQTPVSISKGILNAK